MTENPFEPTISSIADVKEPVPHTASVRAEAWRGFKFGARITGVVMSVIHGVGGLGLIAEMVNVIAVMEGNIPRALIELGIGIGIIALIASLLFYTLVGGIAGCMIMMAAAMIRKRRTRNTNS